LCAPDVLPPRILCLVQRAREEDATLRPTQTSAVLKATNNCYNIYRFAANLISNDFPLRLLSYAYVRRLCVVVGGTIALSVYAYYPHRSFVSRYNIVLIIKMKKNQTNTLTQSSLYAITVCTRATLYILWRIIPLCSPKQPSSIVCYYIIIIIVTDRYFGIVCRIRRA